MSTPSAPITSGRESQRFAQPPDIIGSALVSWLAFCTAMVIGGYFLSICGFLASLGGWLVILVGSCLASYFWYRCHPKRGINGEKFMTLHWTEWLLAGGLALLFLGNLIIVLSSAPGCWDVLTYHLARVGYYLQHGNLDDYHANYWAQEQHGRLTAILFSGTMVLSRFSEKVIGLWQLVAWLVIMLEGYYLCQLLGVGQRSSRIAGGLLGLCIIAVMQATTAQNDLLMASFLGLGIIGVMSYLSNGSFVHLLSATTSVAFAFGIKASALTLAPSFVFISFATTWSLSNATNHLAWRRLVILGAATTACILLVGFPAGYVKNWRAYGNPLGGSAVLKHADQEGPWLQRTALNIGRYTFDFLTIDGLPESWGGDLGTRLKVEAHTLLHLTGVDLEDRAGTRTSFESGRPRVAHNDLSFFGVLGPGLVLPALLFCLWPGRPAPIRWMAIAVIIFFITQAGTGRYDHWRGRHFLYGLVLLAPLLGTWHERIGRIGRMYFALLAALAVISACTAVMWRQPFPLVPYQGQSASHSLDRLQQMVGSDEGSLISLQRFEQIVPTDAHVALVLGLDKPEYAIFGQGLTRKLYPITHSLPNLAIPISCEYLLYDVRFGLHPELGDTHLGNYSYLRRLPVTGGSNFQYETISPPNEPQVIVQDTLVQRLHAPGHMQWSLHGGEREFYFDYGFIPEAYEHGASNGVVFLVELQSLDGSKQVIFQKLLNPAENPQDRGNHTARVSLPPSLPGSQLLLRTDPSQYGDNAWDWSYVSRMQVRR